ncbi:hypothetical protein I7I50_00230 [Histoplasma capsulatum G186AR]|uniref:Uncharacterized protein n=1 Tax=Ajellomyces capsulatus TaxID=5037 RepID=A0A8H7YFE2_AJECA|nr:hypothetical protein I7I52_07499 [Histoplasma capsulatum]QSS72395.1 hypothetical protein I7I50_00230 [Histoplasma capsulatum G186AR]
MSKSEDSEHSKAPKVNAAINDNDDNITIITTISQCGYCKISEYIKANCYHLNSDKASEW